MTVSVWMLLFDFLHSDPALCFAQATPCDWLDLREASLRLLSTKMSTVSDSDAMLRYVTFERLKAKGSPKNAAYSFSLHKSSCAMFLR